MSKIQELLAQKEALDKLIVEAKKTERKAAMLQIKSLMTEFDIPYVKIHEPKKIAAKYQDAKSGALWSGRGRTPKWFGSDSIDL